MSRSGLSRKEPDLAAAADGIRNEISEIRNEPADEIQKLENRNSEEDKKISQSKKCSGKENENRKDEITNEIVNSKINELTDKTEIRLDPHTYFTEEYIYTDQTPYQTILEQVMKRNAKNPDGVIEFTFDEICLLIFDPKFIRDYPQLSDRLDRLIESPDDG